MEIISFSNWFMNNHVLNSLFMKYSIELFGNEEWALRLPNLLALVLYLVYAYKILNHKNPVLSLAVFLLLCSNAALADLFGMARGYGLSCGFMLMSLYHFIAYLKNPKKIHLYAFHFAAALAVLSHFTLLTYYIALPFAFNLTILLRGRNHLQEKEGLLKANLPHLLPVFLCILVLFEPVRRAIMYRQLNVAGNNGFFADTFSSFVGNLTNGAIGSGWQMILSQVLISLMVVVPFALLTWNAIKKDGQLLAHHLELWLLSFFLLFISAFILLNHYLLASDYPTGRFLIFILPLFLLQLGFLTDYFLNTKMKNFALVFVSCLGLCSAAVFISNFSMTVYGGWSYDASTKKMMEDLNAYHLKNCRETTDQSLSTFWLFQPAIRYCQIKEDMNWLLPVERNGTNSSSRFLYIQKDSLESLPIKYQVISEYPLSQTVLIENRSINNSP